VVACALWFGVDGFATVAQIRLTIVAMMRGYLLGTLFTKVLALRCWCRSVASTRVGQGQRMPVQQQLVWVEVGGAETADCIAPNRPSLSLLVLCFGAGPVLPNTLLAERVQAGEPLQTGAMRVQCQGGRGTGREKIDTKQLFLTQCQVGRRTASRFGTLTNGTRSGGAASNRLPHALHCDCIPSQILFSHG
jgi:hypothetical protein